MVMKSAGMEFEALDNKPWKHTQQKDILLSSQSFTTTGPKGVRFQSFIEIEKWDILIDRTRQLKQMSHSTNLSKDSLFGRCFGFVHKLIADEIANRILSNGARPVGDAEEIAKTTSRIPVLIGISWNDFEVKR